jgi:hypothetical protein
LVSAITRASAAAPDPPLKDADPTIEPNEEWGFEDLQDPEQQGDWREPFLEWLNLGILPKDQIVACRLTQRAKSYRIIEGELFRTGMRSVLQRFILPAEGRSLL